MLSIRYCHLCQIWILHNEDKEGFTCSFCLRETDWNKNNKFTVGTTTGDVCFTPNAYEKKAKCNSHFADKNYRRKY